MDKTKRKSDLTAQPNAIEAQILQKVENGIPEFKNKLSTEERIQVLQIIEQNTLRLFSGPIPPPDILEKYEKIFPGIADRVIKLTENQSSHRQEIEKFVIKSQQQQSGRGQIFAFVLAIVALIISLVATLCGYQTVGSIIGGSTVVSLVIVFITGKHLQTKSLQQKNGK